MVLHNFLDSSAGLQGFSEVCRLWFKEVSSFAFYDMCRINEVLTLQRKDVELRCFRRSAVTPDQVTEFGSYNLYNRKTSLAEGRAYNLHKLLKEEAAIDAYSHICNWVELVESSKKHQWGEDDLIFPALTGMRRTF